MNIVFLLGSYYPEPSPTALVAQNIIDAVKEKNYVSVICYQNTKEQLNGYAFDGVQIYTLKNSFHLYERKLTKAMSREYGIKQKLYKILYALYYPLKVIRSITLFPSGEKWYIKEATKILCQINNNNPIDYIVSVCAPFAAHMTGFQNKRMNLNTRWITYSPDLYYICSCNGKSKLYRKVFGKRQFGTEVKMLNNSDMNIYYNNYIHKTYTNKIAGVRAVALYSKLPNMLQYPPIHLPTTGINCLFCGSFLSGVREPHYALKTFEKVVVRNNDIKFHMYGNLFFPDVIRKAVSEHKSNIFSHDAVSVTQIRALMNSADILVDIGNMIDDYRPSKLYEYISTGRPIISFCNNGKFDDELNLYPLALQIDTGKTEAEKAAVMIETFIRENVGKKIEESIINTIFKKNTAEEFQKTINYIFSDTTYENEKHHTKQ